MGTTDHIAHTTPSITMTTPFSESLAVHFPQLTAPTVEELLEDRVTAGPIQFSHVDVVWTPEADKDLLA
ncbi:hypothetical protein [Arthrobacter sp. B1805]|uniref:hypothetical protein n=1 Tax=Arthrobacter sp. B1805 TaxID=2058892 RepID=UPI000CE4E8DA|nr:hypothetical protein [Arthrobacter sp. B1805]